MKKAYIKIYDKEGHLLAKRVVKGYNSKKSFKRYSLPYCLNGLTASNRKLWEKIEFYTYSDIDDIINDDLKKKGVVHKKNI